MNNLEIKNKNHWTSIQKYVVQVFTQSFFIFLILIKSLGFMSLTLGVFISLIIAILKWWTTIFYIKDNMIIYEKGVLFKKKLTIPFSKITTINTEKSLINRIFKTCTVKIDTGAAMEKKAEVILLINESLAEEFNKILLNNKKKTSDLSEEKSKQIEEISIEHSLKVSYKDLLIYSLTINKFVWLFGIFAIWNKINDIVSKSFVNKISSKVDGVVLDAKNTILSTSSFITKMKYLFFLLIIAYLVATMISIIIEFIKYNNFKLYKINNKINVEYGLITRKKYSLSINKIQAVKLKQNIMQQIFGVYSVEVIVIGYGDGDDKKAIIYPIANTKLVEKIIDDFLPKFKFNGKIHTTNFRVFSKFIVKRCLITLFFTYTILYFIPVIPMNYKYLILSIIVLWQFILGCVNYKNNSIGVNKNNIIASSGSMHKNTYLIMQGNVQSITKEQNPLQKLINVCTYKIDICTNSFGQVITVKHLKVNIFKEIEGNLKL